MKYLDKFRFILILLISLAIVFSCQDDDDPLGPEDNTPANVVATLNLPLDVNGKSWHVVFDEDIDPSNGYIYTDNGICGSGTTISFTIEDVPNGVFFVYARVSVNSQFGSPPKPGDLIGIYGGSFVDNIPELPNFTIPEKGEVSISIDLMEVPDNTPADVVGTLNLPFNVNGKSWHVVFDEDIDLSNGYIYTDNGICGSGTTESFFIEDFPKGLYYVYARVSVNSEFGSQPVSGDLIGIYGGSFLDNIPDTPNFAIPENGEVKLSIYLMKVP
ncbi:MAG: hypothetical protein HKN67_03885 [Saprospiraceae bacterium]|nr:hypothetical protein [Bacteroidia bacterium]MBT8230281.1 hypothetical protein [Bacteroidia bacterium]NNF21058.1 hypothetical protein [Saprospiraceae bacterium]NNK89121.1 hypothetical protein [Saprospiraceae bacterium]